jgi:hypothetical protein
VAVAAKTFYSDGYFALDLYPDEPRERTRDDPPVPGFDPESRLWFFWDGEKLERGEYEFVGLTVLQLDRLGDKEFEELARVPLPRVDCPEAALFDAEVADVLRWAQRTYPGAGSTRAPATSAPRAP